MMNHDLDAQLARLHQQEILETREQERQFRTVNQQKDQHRWPQWFQQLRNLVRRPA